MCGAKLAVFATAVSLIAFGAQAVPTVTIDYTLPAQITDANALIDPTSTTGDVRFDIAGNDLNGVAPDSRSPYDGTAFESTALYHSVSAGATAFYDFATDQNSFSIMWGSPDDYNHLDFFLDNVLVFSLQGDDVGNPPAPGMGFVNVTVSMLTFDSVKLSSFDKDAFEFTNVSSVAVPLPASALLLLGALGGLGVVSRRRPAKA